MESQNIFRIPILSSITHLMKMKTHKICINFQLEIFYQQYSKMGLLLVLHMVRQAQEKHLRSMPLLNMQSMIFSKSQEIKNR